MSYAPAYLAAELQLPTNGLDNTILAIYFVVVLGIGSAGRRSVKTSLDFFLSGRSLPAWITGLAFISANLAATEILGMAANSAQYGAYTVHWYWIGTIPAMGFLGLVMMPFSYGSKVRSVPEFLLPRFDRGAHLPSSILFAFAAILIAGVNLYALVRQHRPVDRDRHAGPRGVLPGLAEAAAGGCAGGGATGGMTLPTRAAVG